MRALVWIVEDTWEAAVDAAAALLPADAQVTLLHVAGDAEAVAEGGRRGLLGRRWPPDNVKVLSEGAAVALLAIAVSRLDRDAATLALRGRPEHEVCEAAREADLLVVARDGDRSHAGPRSLGHATRFIVDHAPCDVVLVWPGAAPDGPLPPPPPLPPGHEPGPNG
jgi:nucleotide-binding universal stress UspA family protein